MAMSYTNSTRNGLVANGLRYFVGLLAYFLTSHSIATEFNTDVAEFEPTTCWNTVDSEARTDCGWLIVPEDWNRPEGTKIKLPVVFFRALNPDTSLAPIIYLAGGPGGHPLGDDGKYMDSWRRWIDNDFPGRSMVVFDQRGTGLGVPNLNCEEAQVPEIWWHITKDPDEPNNVPAQVHAAFKICMERHRSAGRQLAAFNTIQSATDVEALRQTLQLDEVILYGLSYGTRLALTVMKHYPEYIKSAVLDSVYPPQVEAVWNDAAAFSAVLDRLFDACQQYKDCALAYPDLRGRLLRALDKLSQQPVIVEINSNQGFETLPVHVDGHTFLSVLRGEMYHIARLPNLAVLISGVAQGEYWRLKQHIENSAYGHFPSSYTMGANLTISCNDDAGFVRPKPVKRDDKLHAYLQEFVTRFDDYPYCEFWKIDPATQNRTAVGSDIPTLILAGGLDPATTIEHARAAAKTLPNSYLFEFPAYGHVQLRSNPCAWEIFDAFLEDPMVRPDPACVAKPRMPAFITVGGN